MFVEESCQYFYRDLVPLLLLPTTQRHGKIVNVQAEKELQAIGRELSGPSETRLSSANFERGHARKKHI